MGLIAKLEAVFHEHERGVYLTLGILGASGWIVYVLGVISRDILLYILIFLFFVNLIINLNFVSFSHRKANGKPAENKDESIKLGKIEGLKFKPGVSSVTSSSY